METLLIGAIRTKIAQIYDPKLCKVFSKGSFGSLDGAGVVRSDEMERD
jgi:hypothetical protein